MSDLIDRQNVLSNGTISRQAAIDELISMRGHIDASMSVIGCTAYEMAIEALREPEIIRCKECRWSRDACGGNIECFVDANVPEYHGYDWFCPNGEMRTDE